MILTLEIPDDLIQNAKKTSLIEEEQTLILTALKNMIDSNNVEKIKDYYGKIELEMDLDTLRKR